MQVGVEKIIQVSFIYCCLELNLDGLLFVHSTSAVIYYPLSRKIRVRAHFPFYCGKRETLRQLVCASFNLLSTETSKSKPQFMQTFVCKMSLLYFCSSHVTRWKIYLTFISEMLTDPNEVSVRVLKNIRSSHFLPPLSCQAQMLPFSFALIFIPRILWHIYLYSQMLLTPKSTFPPLPDSSSFFLF